MNASKKTMSETERALWFFELEKAIDEAQWLAWRVGVVEGRNAMALELYVQLELVRAEVEALRGHNVRSFFDHPPSTAFPGSEDPSAQMPSGISPPPENGSRNEPIGAAFQPPVATKPRLRKARLP